MTPTLIYPQTVPEEQPYYFVAHCTVGHVFVAPERHRLGVCPVCEHQGRPYVPADQYPCRHCGEFPKNHAALEPEDPWVRRMRGPVLACLFSPTKYTPMTPEEVEARAR
jgi:hypothetical protein